MSLLSSNVVAAKSRLAEGYEELRRRHEGGGGGGELSAAMSELRDGVLLDLFSAAAASIDPTHRRFEDRIALVAHGGYGRGDLAPFSDVDLMILRHRRGPPETQALAERFFRDVFDAGLALGHSLRTPGEAVRLAQHDPQICTSLMESRLLAGDGQLLDGFVGRFDRMIRQRPLALVGAIEKERRGERIRFGETVYLLEPNVKRSRGGLRDLQLLRWIARARYGTSQPEELLAMGLLSREDREALRQATEYLLWLRNEIHFHAGKPGDVLDRAEQVRIAERLGYQASTGLLPVEKFMRDHFRHTNRVSHVATRFFTRAQFRRRLGRLTTALLGHRVGDGFYVGPTYITANASGRRRLEGDLTAIMQMVDLANRYDKPIDPEAWELIRLHADRLDETIPPQAVAHFMSLLEHPGRLGSLLRLMHEARLLERFIPAFAHARGLLQFNQYHKYTVDEHSFRAVDRATDFLAEEGPLGDVYRGIRRKGVLHLALLLHDLGKGYPDDHCDVGRTIARQTAKRLGLDGEETSSLELLVFKHLLMNHLALRRDTHDEQVTVRLAIEVGSAELLGMLFVMTASDLAAVGPGVWDRWKADVLTDLYRRCLAQLAGESFPVNLQEQLEKKREVVRKLLEDKRNQFRPEERLDERLASLPAGYLSSTSPQQIAGQLETLERLAHDEVDVNASYQPETRTILATVAAHEDITPGIFHKLTGALSSRGLEILSAEIITLPGGLVLDRFQVVDPDYAGCPPAGRFDEIRRSLEASLGSVGQRPPTFRRTWQVGATREPKARVAQTQVRVDNGTSEDCTILDIFAADRPGLLYGIARTLFELGLSVKRAKIGTMLDQVLDVFYVTDQEGRKIEDRFRHQEIRGRLLKVILSHGEEGEEG